MQVGSKFFLFIFFLVNTTLLNGASYDQNVLKIFSKTLPRFVMMSSQKEKLKDSINICILHNEIDTRYALSLKKKLNQNYPNGLKNYTLRVKNSSFDKLSSCEDSQLVFLFNTSKKNVKNTLKYVKEKQILSVSYDSQYLADGVQTSLFIGKKTTPYICVRSLKENGIVFENILLRISKIYTEMDE